ncbi:MAG: ArnT family glycosyltransferase, partial [Fimbriiglobus sp.]
MEAAVGGRLETVAPRPITDVGDRLRLVALMLLAVAVHGWLVANTYVTARDSLRFARAALLMGNPSHGQPEGEAKRSVSDVFRAAEDPPGFPVAVYVTSLAVREVYHPVDPNPLATQMLLSTQIASAVAGVLLVFPTYWLGRQLFGKFPGFIAAAVFQVLPVPAHVTADGLSDGLCLLGLGTSLFLGVRAVGKPSIGTFLQVGLATGAAFLVRPEGILGGLACGLVAGLMGLTGARPRPATAAWLTALAVGTALPATPYMVLIGGISNKPTVQGVQDEILKIRQRFISGTPASAGAAPVGLFADMYVPPGDAPKAAWLARAVLK